VQMTDPDGQRQYFSFLVTVFALEWTMCARLDSCVNNIMCFFVFRILTWITITEIYAYRDNRKK